MESCLLLDIKMETYSFGNVCSALLRVYVYVYTSVLDYSTGVTPPPLFLFISLCGAEGWHLVLGPAVCKLLLDWHLFHFCGNFLCMYIHVCIFLSTRWQSGTVWCEVYVDRGTWTIIWHVFVYYVRILCILFLQHNE